MTDSTHVTKGSKVRAKWFKAKQLGTYSIAGQQPKLVGDYVEVTGVVRHIRGDHPTRPTVRRLYVDPEGDWTGPTVALEGCTCGRPHIEIDPRHVTQVISE